jgi:(p)ppGpp synthase/HD superfamily hydrolase
MNLIEKAKDYAKNKHGNRLRKFTKELYYFHPYAVADRIRQFKKYKTNEDIIAAAYLHDLIEDTEVTLPDLTINFSREIANIVLELTSNSNEINNVQGNSTWIKKGKYLTKKINHMSDQARIIKLADREHNVSQLEGSPKSFQMNYARETEYILKNLSISPSNEEKILIKSILEKITPFLGKL